MLIKLKRFTWVFALTLSACGVQPPVDVVDGYSQQRIAYNNSAPVDINNRAFNLQSEAIAASQQEEKYFVHGGDRLEQIAKHFGVREEMILARNSLQSENDMPSGEYIVIPSPNWQADNVQLNSYRLTDKFKVKNENILLETVKQPINIIEMHREHILKPGENIFRIALKYNVSQFDILAANNIRNPSDLKPGMVIKIPQAGEKMKGREGYKYLAAEPSQSKFSASTIRKMQVNGDKRQVKTSPAAADSYYGALAKTYKTNSVKRKGMVWPAKGLVVKTFGNKGRGVSHSGINIALAKDDPIHAAETGTVIYSDNGLELYGNLVLIQHRNGYVTAYAHNAKNLVKRHDKVKKGQLIAFAGDTGNVEKVQLHFEVRKNSQPINPLKVLPKQ